MLLSLEDIENLERVGYDRSKFIRFDKQGFARLRNVHSVCTFYDPERDRCKIYRHRPAGCRIYPVMYSEKEGVVVDTFCPTEATVSEAELKRKGKKVIELLHRIDSEAASSRNQVKRAVKPRAVDF